MTFYVLQNEIWVLQTPTDNNPDFKTSNASFSLTLIAINRTGGPNQMLAGSVGAILAENGYDDFEAALATTKTEVPKGRVRPVLSQRRSVASKVRRMAEINGEYSRTSLLPSRGGGRNFRRTTIAGKRNVFQ